MQIKTTDFMFANIFAILLQDTHECEIITNVFEVVRRKQYPHICNKKEQFFYIVNLAYDLLPFGLIENILHKKFTFNTN